LRGSKTPSSSSGVVGGIAIGWSNPRGASGWRVYGGGWIGGKSGRFLMRKTQVVQGKTTSTTQLIIPLGVFKEQ